MSYLVYFMILLADCAAVYILTENVELTIATALAVVCGTCLMQSISFLSLRAKKLTRLCAADKTAIERALSELKYCSVETGSQLPKKLRIYMNMSPDVNAFAVGMSRIVITRGMLELLRYDGRSLAAVLAHEVGHLKRFHCYATAIVNLNIIVIAAILSAVNFGIVFLVVGLLFLMLSIIMNDVVAYYISGFVGKLLKAVLGILRNAVVFLHTAVAAVFFRRMEYNADAEAAKMALSVELTEFLYMLDNIERYENRSFIEELMSSHPSSYSRIKHLEEHEAGIPLLLQ